MYFLKYNFSPQSLTIGLKISDNGEILELNPQLYLLCLSS